MIAAMITPALLILASASLIATALVRLARVVDRVRKLSEHVHAPPDEKEIKRHEHRALLAERSVSLYFSAIVCFAVAGFGIAIDHAVGDRLTWFPVAATIVGMSLIVADSVAMLAECRLAFAQIRAEIAALS